MNQSSTCRSTSVADWSNPPQFEFIVAASISARTPNHLASIDEEIAGINDRLDDEDVEKKERLALVYRLGQLAYQRNDAERAYEDARSRARNL